MGKIKFYAIARGRSIGIFEKSWDEVCDLVDGFPRAIYKGFKTAKEAEEYLEFHLRSLGSEGNKCVSGPSTASSKRDYDVDEDYDIERLHPAARQRILGDLMAPPAYNMVAQPLSLGDMLPEVRASDRSMASSWKKSGSGANIITVTDSITQDPKEVPALIAVVKGEAFLSTRRTALPTKSSRANNEAPVLSATVASNEVIATPQRENRKEEVHCMDLTVRGDDGSDESTEVLDLASDDTDDDEGNEQDERRDKGSSNKWAIPGTEEEDDGYASSSQEVATEKPPPENFTLSTSQQKVLMKIMNRESVFFTGAAGTGKSFILTILQHVLKRLKKESQIAFTAPTGVAACNIRGMTIHSWASIGLGEGHADVLARKVSRDGRLRWKEVDILVIDEISMLPADLFDKISYVGQHVRGDPRPFGGLQVILCGDFFQLPPVGLGQRGKEFCYMADAWQRLFGDRPDNMLVLDKVFRQKDPRFRDILNELRRGMVSRETQMILDQKVRESAQPLKNDIKPTKLYSKNVDVDGYNRCELLKLDEEGEITFHWDRGDIGGALGEKAWASLQKGTKAQEKLTLRKGAQVMLLKNLDTSKGLVNGARGIVEGFVDAKKFSSRFPMVPVVKFSVSGGKEHIVPLKDEVWDIRQGDRPLAWINQLPLMLAWAISIHKSQGMTIRELEVSLDGVFEFGQGYVALSRAVDLDGLILHNFNPHVIRAHGQVREFYNIMGYDKEVEIDSETTSSQSKDLVATSITELAESFLPHAALSLPDNNDGWISAIDRDKKRADTINFRELLFKIPADGKPDMSSLHNRPSSSSSSIMGCNATGTTTLGTNGSSSSSSYGNAGCAYKESSRKIAPIFHQSLSSRLSEEEKRRIEANKQAALKRQQHVLGGQQPTPTGFIPASTLVAPSPTLGSQSHQRHYSGFGFYPGPGSSGNLENEGDNVAVKAEVKIILSDADRRRIENNRQAALRKLEEHRTREAQTKDILGFANAAWGANSSKFN